MEKLPTELLQKILLPEVFEWPAAFDETSASIDELWDPNFRMTWKRSWVYRRVCRRLKEVLDPIVSASFKRQAVGCLMFINNSYQPYERPQVSWLRFERDALYDVFSLTGRVLKDKQLVSLIYNIYQTLDGPKAAWPSLHGFPNLEMSRDESESLLFSRMSDVDVVDENQH